jgi:FtsP/CotA-like multicopper oxidase with cupredoxin domain
MAWSARVVLGTAAAVSIAMAGRVTPLAPREGPIAPPEIETNDNTVPAGTLKAGVLSIRLVASEGQWFPEGRGGASHTVYAFGEDGQAVRNPGPLVRVPAGTEIRAVVRNAIDGHPLTVHGLHDRPGPASGITIATGDSAAVRFRLSAAGTYYYWGTTRRGPTLVDRTGKDAQLLGAIIVDPPGAVPDDRVFVIGIEEDSGAIPARRRLRAAVVNGKSWPDPAMIHTVTVGDSVRMRWINASSRFHPMHLHGFYFRVDGRGDIATDSIYPAAGRRQAVTEMMIPGSTMSLTWVPERIGNWLLHCHMAEHMSPRLRGGGASSHDAGHVPNHAMQVMAGLVTGWRVVSRDSDGRDASGDQPDHARRAIRLLVQSSPRQGSQPGLGFVVQTGTEEPALDSIDVPGAPLILTRGEPVEITVVNRLDEATSVHWHGIELDSYFDGVSGWSGVGARITPPVPAQDSFVVRFTPPRAGTFIYHSHFDEERQLLSGLYGPLLVMEQGQRFDPSRDLPWVLSQTWPATQGPILLNGSANPAIDLMRGETYRLRLINISPNVPMTFAMREDSTPVRWRAVAKDGADLPSHQAVERAAVQLIGVGEAYDFEFTPVRAGTLRVTARGPFGPIRMTGEVRVSEPPGRP